MSRTRERGFTLPEVIVAGFIAGLIGIIVYNLFETGGRLFMRGQARTDLQSAGLLAIGKIARELRLSACSTLTIVTPTGEGSGALSGDIPGAIAFQVANPDFNIEVFKPATSFVIYYLDARDRKIIRKVVESPRLADRSLEMADRQRELLSACNTPPTAKTTATVASYVYSFVAVPARFPSSDTTQANVRDPRIELKIVLTNESAPTMTGKWERVDETVGTSLVMRNKTPVAGVE